MLVTGPSKGNGAHPHNPNFLMALREGFLKIVFVSRAVEVVAFFGWLVVRQ